MRHPVLSHFGITARCYDEFWLDDDMENMGYMFEYFEDNMKELYGITYPLDVVLFMNDFMCSRHRAFMETGHPALLSEAAIDTLEKYINREIDGKYSKYKLLGGRRHFRENQLYWVGECYAYLHFRTKLSSIDLVTRLPVERMLHDYICGHQMEYEEYYYRHRRELKPV